MKIRNTTDCDTAQLRTWLKRVVREVEGSLKHAHPLGWSPTIVGIRAANVLKHCDVWVRQRRVRDYATGRAHLSGHRLRITIGSASLAHYLWIARHEVWHLFGVEHEHFPEAIMHLTPSALVAIHEVYGVAEGATLPPASPPEPKPAPTAEDRATVKLARLAEREKAWRTKLKRAETALAKIRKSQKYYEKQCAVAARRSS